MNMEKECCKNCKFFRSNDWKTKKDEGYCYRHAPKPNVGLEYHASVYWPEVRAEWWCGEHQPTVKFKEKQEYFKD